MVAHSLNASDGQSFGTDARVQIAMTLFHGGGTRYALLAINAGAHLYMMRMPDPAAALAMLEAEKIAHTFDVPALMAATNQVPGAAERGCSAPRRCRCR